MPCLPLNCALFSRIALRKGVFIFGLVAALSHFNNVSTIFVAKLCFSKLSSTGACSRLIPAKLSRFGLFLTKYNVFVFLLLNYVFSALWQRKDVIKRLLLNLCHFQLYRTEDCFQLLCSLITSLSDYLIKSFLLLVCFLVNLFLALLHRKKGFLPVYSLSPWLKLYLTQTTFLLFLALNYAVFSLKAPKACFRLVASKLHCFELYLMANNGLDFLLRNYPAFCFIPSKRFIALKKGFSHIGS